MGRMRRREGFAGQHMAVVPAPIRESASRHPLLKGLLVTDAGHFPKAAGHWVSRPQGAPTHLLIACLGGSGWVKGLGGMLSIRPGRLVWLNAHCPHAYGSSDADPWTISWAHFTGDEAVEWRSQLGLPATGDVAMGSVAEDRVSDLRLERVHDALEHGYSLPQLITAAAALRSSFCAAIQLAHLDGSTRPASRRVAAVVERIRESPESSRRLGDLAAAAHLSVPHFSDLFRRQTGYAPIDYVIRQRIRRACQLLDTTEAAVGAIAAEVGYSDSFYFARSFRSVMGVSPRSYRRVVKG